MSYSKLALLWIPWQLRTVCQRDLGSRCVQTAVGDKHTIQKSLSVEFIEWKVKEREGRKSKTETERKGKRRTEVGGERELQKTASSE